MGRKMSAIRKATLAVSHHLGAKTGRKCEVCNRPSFRYTEGRPICSTHATDDENAYARGMLDIEASMIASLLPSRQAQEHHQLKYLKGRVISHDRISEMDLDPVYDRYPNVSVGWIEDRLGEAFHESDREEEERMREALSEFGDKIEQIVSGANVD